MRYIKFRAWHKEEKLMGKVVSIEFSDDGSGEIKEIEVFLGDEIKKPYMTEDEAKYYELMQYTGIKDKNGKEVFNGDIIVLFGLDYIPTQVIFKNGGYGYETSVSHSMFVCFAENTNLKTDKGLYVDIEVIGNIYQNNGLLKDKK